MHIEGFAATNIEDMEIEIEAETEIEAEIEVEAGIIEEAEIVEVEVGVEVTFIKNYGKKLFFL